MTLDDAWKATFRAIDRVLEEHGPDAGACTLAELEMRYGGADRLIAGRALRKFDAMTRAELTRRRMGVYGIFHPGDQQ